MIEGQSIYPSPGERITCLRSGSDGGAFIFELELGPGVGGPPMHSHDECDEIIEVISGAIDFRTDGPWKTHGPGEAVTLAPGEAHTFRNPSKRESVLCKVTHGSRFERAIEQPDMLHMALFIAQVDPGASRVQSRFMNGCLRLLAAIARLRGIRVEDVAGRGAATDSVSGHSG